MNSELEVLRLKQEIAQRKAQSLERDILVLEYKKLLEEIGGYMQLIMRLEEEVKKHEANPINPDDVVVDPSK